MEVSGKFLILKVSQLPVCFHAFEFWGGGGDKHENSALAKFHM